MTKEYITLDELYWLFNAMGLTFIHTVEKPIVDISVSLEQSKSRKRRFVLTDKQGNKIQRVKIYTGRYSQLDAAKDNAEYLKDVLSTLNISVKL